jgi:hypothetical protein
MSNRRQIPFEVGQMGKVWVASISLMGISAIGATEAAAIEGVLEAFKTHSTMGGPQPELTCESCT